MGAVSQADDKPDFFMRPVLTVADVPASIDYYCAKLGFKVRWSHGPDGVVRIAEVQRPGLELILQRDTSVPSSAAPAVISATLHDHIKLDALHDQLARAGAIIRKPPFQVSWQAHVHQMEVEDPDGNLLLFWGDLP
jgi:catechol 2,3-dioxygenase-like lactoylglutathione lyase family enzyme